MFFSHGLTRIDADESERLTADRTGGNVDRRMTSTVGVLSAETERKSFEQR